MSEEKFSDLNEDVYMILSHPIRRKILTHLHYNSKISFTIMSKEWKHATGTIYHHLKLLGSLIEQNADQEYRLTDLGKEVCNWFITTPSGQAKVSRIDAINSVSIPGTDLFDRYWKQISIVLFALFIFSLPVLEQFNLIIFGPMIVPSNDLSGNIILWNIVGLVLFPSLFFLILKITDRTKITKIKVYSVFLIPIGLNIIFIQSVFLISQTQSITISGTLLLVISFIQQIIFLGIMSITLIQELNYNADRSILLSILSIYIILVATIAILF